MALEPTQTDHSPPAGQRSEPSAGGLLGAIASAVLAISVFLAWYTVHWQIAGAGHSEAVNGWDATNVARVVFVFALIGLGALAIELFSASSELPVPASIVSGVCGILAVLFIGYRIASAPDTKVSGLLGFTALQNFISVSVDTSWGIWVSLAAAVAMVAGAVLALRGSRT
ncbi:MAG: hypothetical protein ACHQEA_10335 [Gaiellales bacterium]|jgi:phosphate starvation-inducible membrane PsiE